jgi:hypothetical protein
LNRFPCSKVCRGWWFRKFAVSASSRLSVDSLASAGEEVGMVSVGLQLSLDPQDRIVRLTRREAIRGNVPRDMAIGDSRAWPEEAVGGV